MKTDTNAKKEGKPKGFFGRIIERIDKRMEEKAKNSPCYCTGKDKGDKACCS